MPQIDSLMKKTVNPDLLTVDGIYTSPRSFGVYKLTSNGSVGKKYRFGNHPVRLEELIREYGTCEIEAIFLDRSEAEMLADLLNTSDE